MVEFHTLMVGFKNGENLKDKRVGGQHESEGMLLWEILIHIKMSGTKKLRF